MAGTSHIATQRLCDDIYRVRLNQDMFLFAVADGAGSAEYGRRGARLACAGVMQAIQNSLKEGVRPEEDALSVVENWLEAGHIAIRKYADKKFEGQMRPFACTMMCGLVGPTGGMFGQVGDGVIVIRGEGFLHPVVWPYEGTYANTTVFLSDCNWKDHERCIFQPEPISDILVTTDGLQNFVLDRSNRTVFAPFVEPLLMRLHRQQPDEVEAFLYKLLNSDEVNRRTDDDKTIVLASLKQG